MKEFLERIKMARFETTSELFQRRKQIREEVQSFDYDTYEIYKWYFYFQLCMLKNPLKETLWNYLSKEKISPNDEMKVSSLYRQYKIKCQKISQYQKRKDEEKGIKKEEIDKKTTITINSVEDLIQFM